MNESIWLMVSTVSVLIGFIMIDGSYLSDRFTSKIMSPRFFFIGAMLMVSGFITFPWSDAPRIVSSWQSTYNE